jgi:hypothetical protein
MGIGVSILLFALGAILTFAADFSINGLDVTTVGVILMFAGVLGLAMIRMVARQRSKVTEHIVEEHQPYVPYAPTYQPRTSTRQGQVPYEEPVPGIIQQPRRRFR